VEASVDKPAEALGMVNVITYQKGGSLLRMLEQFIGEDVFRDGIRHYLARNKFGNAETTDLWDAIEHVAPGSFPIRSMMDSWIFRGGPGAVGRGSRVLCGIFGVFYTIYYSIANITDVDDASCLTQDESF
jgi:aminopeptidase N